MSPRGRGHGRAGGRGRGRGGAAEVMASRGCCCRRRGRAGTADAMASRGCCCRGRRVGAVAAGATPPCQRHNPHRLTGRDPFGSRPVFLFGGLLDEDACRVDDLRSEGGGSIRHHRVAARSLRTQCESTECCSPWSSGIVQTPQGVPRVVGGVPTIHRRLRPVRYGVLTLRRGLRPVRRGVPQRVSYVVHGRHKQCFVR